MNRLLDFMFKYSNRWWLGSPFVFAFDYTWLTSTLRNPATKTCDVELFVLANPADIGQKFSVFANFWRLRLICFFRVCDVHLRSWKFIFWENLWLVSSFPRPLQQRTPRQSFIVISRGNDIVCEVLIPFASFNWDVRGLCCTLSSMIKLAF